MRKPYLCLLSLASIAAPLTADAQQVRQPPDTIREVGSPRELDNATPPAPDLPLRQPPGATDQIRTPDGRGLITPPVTQFTVLRADIQFDGGSLFEIVKTGDTLRAELRILSDGAGLFFGTWEVSDPDISGFRPLARVRIPSAGRQTRRLVSPTLPTTRFGLYELRFRPASGAPTEIIRYSVVPAPSQDSDGIVLVAPQPGLALRPETTFRWKAVPGAVTYQLQILGGRQRLVAVDLPDTSTRLRPPALAHLRDYAGPLDWRVVAYDAEGRVLSISEMRPTDNGSAP